MIVGFHSRGQQAGKDTAAQFAEQWCEETGVRYEWRSMAAKMKLLTALTLGFDVEGMTDREVVALVDRFKLDGSYMASIKGWGGAWGTGRDFLINLAGDSAETGARGLFGDRFWVDQCLPLDACVSGPGKLVCIADVRFVPEAIRIRALGGQVVEVVSGRAQDAGGRSEQGLPRALVDVKLHNDGTLEDWEHTVRAYLTRLKQEGTL